MKIRFLIPFLFFAFYSLNALSEPISQDSPDPTIVFIVSNDPLNYEAHVTIPRFAKKLQQEKGYKVKVIEAKGIRKKAKLPGIRSIKKSDLLVVFCRRLALRPGQMKIIKEYIESGKPVMGIRSANHAFSIRDSVAQGYVDWWEFVPDVLGCENRGHSPNPEPVKILPSRMLPRHPATDGINFNAWTTPGHLYKSLPLLDPDADILLEGKTGGLKEPVAWTRYTDFGGMVFYTSLGVPDDFINPQFVILLENTVQWILNENKK